MPAFGKSSKKRLGTCDERLQDLFNEVIKNYDCSVLEGHRGEERQNELYSSNPQRSKVQWPNSKHNSNPSKGIDVAPYPIDWENTNRFYHFVGYVLATADQMGIRIRSGSDWDSDKDFSDQTFNDLPHFEILD